MDPDYAPVEESVVDPAPVEPSATDAGTTKPRIRPKALALSMGLTVMLAFVLGLSLGFRSGIGMADELAYAPTAPASLPPEFATYVQAWQILHDQYVNPTDLDSRELIYGSIEGLVRAVGDTDHTRFLTPEELAAAQGSLSGEVVGIGAIMSSDSDEPVVQSVIPGGPADTAGVRSRDRVIAVDGESTAGQDLDMVIGQIRGEAGTVVRLTVLREDSPRPIELSIVRSRVQVPAVSWVMLPGTTIADLRLEDFSDGSSGQLAVALGEARDAGATAIILDMRSNPGGYVEEATSVASLFIEDGTIYRQRDRAGKVTETPVQQGIDATDLPMVVLIDAGSASAAEIVSGALQDADRAVVIGQTSFGTGTVLSEFKLVDGSALLVGTLEWLTRDGRRIWREGIVPDVVVPVEESLLTPDDIADLPVGGPGVAGDSTIVAAIEALGATGAP